jgi:multiple sugar transport system ATP-binding protein
MARLELIGISKRYGSVVAVEDASFVVNDNELFCLFGPPGCGKSVLLRLMLGLESPDAGRILINGRDVTHLPPAERDLAMVFQNLALFPHMSARANIAFPLVERKVDRAAIEMRVKAVSRTLHIEHLLDKIPAHLSGGERQRVAIGRALVRTPNAFFMDEPISALDARLREEMRVELGRLQRQFGHTFVHVTHDQEEAMAIADRICIMQRGRIVQIGEPLAVYNQPTDVYAARQLGSPPINLLAGRVDRSGMYRAVDSSLEVQLASAWGATDAIDAVELGIRPEDVLISRGPGGDGSLEARIYAVEPLGPYAIVDLHLGERLVRAQVQGQPDFRPGEAVFARFELAKCHLFAAAGSQQRLGSSLG